MEDGGDLPEVLHCEDVWWARYAWEKDLAASRQRIYVEELGWGCLAAAFKLPARVAASWRCRRLRRPMAIKQRGFGSSVCYSAQIKEWMNINYADGK